MTNFNTYGGWMAGESGGSGPGSMSQGEVRDGSARVGSGSHQAQWSSSGAGNPNERRNDQLGPADHYYSSQNSSFNPDWNMSAQQQQQPDSFDNKALAQGDDLPNDCEILCIDKPDYAYVTRVEDEIKNIGLRVDIMIPNPHVNVSDFIEDLSTKGIIFAVVIRPDNVEQRNVSVHVLQGQLKEHPNLSLATACNLIQKTYLELNKKEIGVLPENTKNILRYVLEEKPLTDQEYGIVIAFFQERRKRQASFENRTSRGHNEKVYYCQKELQQRILALLGGTPDPTSRRTMDQNSMNTVARADSSGYGNPGQNQGQGPPMEHTTGSYLL